MARFGARKKPVSRKGSRRAPGELADEVLATLWAADRPLTAGDVHERLDLDIAYNTVLTILTRLHEKELAERDKVGRSYAYRPVMGPAQLAATRMRDLLERGHEPAVVLQHFVDGLSAEDERLLRGLLAKEARDAR